MESSRCSALFMAAEFLLYRCLLVYARGSGDAETGYVPQFLIGVVPRPYKFDYMYMYVYTTSSSYEERSMT